MHRAFSFPVTGERSRTKERLEASLVGLCELELRKQRQECLVLGALALGDPGPCFSSWGQENLTLRRQLVRSWRVPSLRHVRVRESPKKSSSQPAVSEPPEHRPPCALKATKVPQLD